MRSLGAFFAILFTIQAVSGCSEGAPPGGDLTTLELLATTRARFPGLGPMLDQAREFESTAEGFRPAVPVGPKALPGGAWRVPGPHRLEALLPHQANGVTRISSGPVTLELRAVDARDVSGAITDNALVYPDAYPHADSISVAELDRVEEFILLHNRQAPRRFEYRVQVVRGGGRVRQNAGVVEVLDAAGVAWLRLARPYLVDAKGKQVEARAKLAGDRLSVALPDEQLAYPVLLDPGWSTTKNMATSRFNFVAVALASGKVLVASGSVHSNLQTTACELFDAKTGTWTTTGSMTEPRWGAGAVRLASGRVLVAGGAYFASPSWVKPKSAELYDPMTGTWTKAAPIKEGRVEPYAVLLNTGEALIFGGGQLATAERYDPVKDSWTTSGSMPKGMHYATATVLTSGKVLVAGGICNSCSPRFFDTALLYDPVAHKFSYTGKMPRARFRHGAARLASGKVLLAGGTTGQSGGQLAAVDLYDPTSGSWSATGGLAKQTIYQAVQGLITGKVLVAGGTDAKNNKHLTPELYDPGTGTWSAAEKLPFGMSSIASVVLTSGEVLMLDKYAPSPLLYDPSAGLACTSAAQCVGGRCVDGVCCESACQETCKECVTQSSGGGTAGKCVFIAAGTPDLNATVPCTGTGTCDGAGACKKSNGQSCASAASCPSGHCVDGVCCASACQGTCVSCAVSGSLGQCTPVPAGTQDGSGATPCSGASACDGKGGCKKGNGQVCTAATECGSASCVDGICCTSACQATCMSCNVTGSLGKCALVPAGKPDANATTPCSGSGVSNGKGACKQINGQACTAGSQCGSGICTDSVCCDKVCAAICQACNLAGKAGACSSIPAGLPDPGVTPPCSGILACDGKGSCKKNNGQACSSAVECGSGQCSAGVCCDKPCAASCEACNLTGKLGTCSLIPAGKPDPGASPPCSGTMACDGKGVCKKAVGVACKVNADCLNNTCVDNICCSSLCSKTCESCAVSGKEGTCTLHPAKSDPDKECLGKDPKCGGQCDGSGQCDFPGVGTGCGTCKACDGTGQCTTTPVDDKGCGVIDCDKLDTKCRDYQDLITGRCDSLGLCKKANTQTACTKYTDLPCDAGVADAAADAAVATDARPAVDLTPNPDRGGKITAPPGGDESSCQVGSRGGSGHGAWLWLLGIFALVFRATRRASPNS